MAKYRDAPGSKRCARLRACKLAPLHFQIPRTRCADSGAVIPSPSLPNSSPAVIECRGRHAGSRSYRYMVSLRSNIATGGIFLMDHDFFFLKVSRREKRSYCYGVRRAIYVRFCIQTPPDERDLSLSNINTADAISVSRNNGFRL